jgi:hypothetical protein
MDLHTAGIGKALYDLAIGGRGARLSAVKERGSQSEAGRSTGEVTAAQ